MTGLLHHLLNWASLVLGLFGGVILLRVAESQEELYSVIRGVVFQLTLSFLTLYVTSSGGNIFASALLLSALGRTFLLQYRDSRRGELGVWFAALQRAPASAGRLVYFSLIGFLFLYSLFSLIAQVI